MACGPSAPATHPGATKATAAAPASGVLASPNDAHGPATVEIVVVSTKWVERYVPFDAFAGGDEAAFKRAHAAEYAKKLADEIGAGLRAGDPGRRAIARAIESTLGESALADPDRPAVVVVLRDRPAPVHLLGSSSVAIDAFARSAKDGVVLEPPTPWGKGPGWVLARAARAHD